MPDPYRRRLDEYSICETGTRATRNRFILYLKLSSIFQSEIYFDLFLLIATVKICRLIQTRQFAGSYYFGICGLLSRMININEYKWIISIISMNRCTPNLSWLFVRTVICELRLSIPNLFAAPRLRMRYAWEGAQFGYMYRWSLILAFQLNYFYQITCWLRDRVGLSVKKMRSVLVRDSVRYLYAKRWVFRISIIISQ